MYFKKTQNRVVRQPSGFEQLPLKNAYFVGLQSTPKGREIAGLESDFSPRQPTGLSNKSNLLLALCLTVFLFSCRTYSYNRQDPYPDMEIARFGNSHAYISGNKLSDKLLIMIEGSGWSSVTGEKQGETWVSVQMGAQMLQELGDDYTVLLLEKLNRQPGLDYSNDMEDRANYTAENLLACYTESINSYLAERDFSSVVIMGASEGALLLPLVYENIDKKGKITALVSLAFGGFSMFESYAFMLNYRTDIPPEYREMHQIIVNLYHPDNEEFPDSFEEDVFDLTFRWFNSFLNITPRYYYESIEIPVLFVHGDEDYKVPVESTIFMQESYPDKPFEYLYYPWDHQPKNKEQVIVFRREIADWIREKAK